MASHIRILNITRGYSLKRTAAERAIRECSVEWVEIGKTVRSLTLAESIAARNEQARMREPLPYSEIPGLRYKPSINGAAATMAEAKLVWAAHDFLMQAAQ